MIIFICLMFLTLSCVSATDEGIILTNADYNNLDDDFNILDDSGNINLANDGLDDVNDDINPDDSMDESELIASFTELDDLIDQSDNIVYLTQDYEAIGGEDNLTIAKSVTIYGNNHTLNCKNSSIIIDTNDSQIIFKNITFKDASFIIGDVQNVNVMFQDHVFENQIQVEDIIVNKVELRLTTTGTIDKKIKQLALSIIGNSKDLAACKLLAVWVGKNIKHETRAGFYQSPLTTLNRKLGNCCSQTNLFLQMCEAVGLTKTHKFYFIHTGKADFGKRHFFAMVDNLVVDVDAKSSNPWGHASISNNEIYRVTEYPYLPLLREY